MIKLIFFFGLAIFISEVAIGQKELDKWFFGNNAGLNFNSGAPNFLPGGKVVSAAASSAISDDQGNLLFYSDGVTVWNRNHQPMPNGTGLLGDVASTQTVLITYYPGNKDLYYIFTVDKAGGSNGFRISVVDMKLNGGLGDVDITQKNIDYNLPAAEKLTAVKKQNGRDLWLIVHGYGTYFEDAFFVFSIDCKGILLTKVSNIGSHINTPDNTRGYMKASPDGKKLVSANFAGDFEMFDFDNTTGILSNFQTIPSSSGNSCGPYGVEFSPDSRLLYLTESSTCSVPHYSIWQYKLDPDISAAIASKVSLDAGGGNLAGALQIGPDNKIYIAYDGASNLGVINNPNVYGPGCGFLKAGPSISPATSTLGLSSAIAGFQRNTLGADTTVCDGAPLTLKLNLQATTYIWNDGSLEDHLVVTKSGKYWVDLISTNANGADCPITDTINVTFQSPPTFTLGNDTLICQDKLPLILAPALPPAAYLWQDSTTKASYSAPAKGLYWLQLTANGCSARDSIDIATTAGTPFSLGEDTSICAGDTLKLTANITATGYLWSTGSTANTISVKAAGTYWCEAKYANGCSYRDSIQITLTSLPVFNLGKDTIVCQNQFPLLLSQTITGATYLWQDSSTTYSFSIPGTGLYWLRVTVSGCSSRDSIIVKNNPVPAFSLGADTVVCSANPFVLTVNPAFTTYLWNTGSTSKSISITNDGVYWCEVSNSTGCSYRDSIQVTLKIPPVVNLGKDTTLCQNQFPYRLSQSIAGASYLWQDGSAGNSFNVIASGTYWLQATLNGCSSRDSIIVKNNPVPAFSLGADTVVCTANPFVLTVNPAFTTYLWNTGSTSKSISITNDGVYWCEVSNSTGCSYRDSIQVTLKIPPVVNLGKDTTLCQNQFPYRLSQSIAGASYLWQDGSAGNSFNVIASGTYWLQATLNGCSSRDSITVKSNAVPSFNLGADTILCAGNRLTLTVNPAFAGYLWSTGSTSKSINVTTDGTYWCEAINSSGCSYRDSINVIFKPSPVVSLGNDTSICPNAFPFVIGQVIPGVSYLWQDGSTNSRYTVTRPGTYSVRVALNGCSAGDTISIVANTVNSFTLGADTTLCSPVPLTLKANTTVSNYLWNTGSTAPSITVNTSGDYWCEINRGTGCGFSDTIKVVFAAPIVFSLGRDTVICDNKTLLLDVNNKGDSYTWQDNSKQPQYMVSKSGTYYVAVTKGTCVKSDTIVVTYSGQTLPDLGADKTICPGEEILLDANVSANAYLWQDGSTGRTHKVTAPGIYSVQVINECGTNMDEIIISSGACKLMIPNAFTPGKSTNAVFRVLKASDVKDFNFQVFSRWGQQVFQTYKPSEGWDGKYKGIEQPAGTYVYTVSYTDATGKKDVQKGTVILVR